ncbi:MAG: hypothetical protein J6S69_02715, partial [Proteobacteria bacterium]|nr:hypothetical protein [Pseudomonadota bacterium]
IIVNGFKTSAIRHKIIHRNVRIGNTIENKNTFEYPDGDAANAAGQPGRGGDSPAGEDAFGMDGKSGYTGFVYTF